MIPGPLNLLDLLALAVFAACGGGYALVVDRMPSVRSRSVIAAMDHWRHRWMRRAARRDARIVDSSIIGTLAASVQFFATTTIFILGGLVAMLGAGERAFAAVRALPFAADPDPVRYEIQVMSLMVVFVYCFFKLTWSLRQFNYASIALGAIPHVNEDENADAVADVAARVANRGARHLNSGIRAYYFGVALLTWFVHPVALMVASIWVVVVLYRREFRSALLEALGQDIRSPLTGR